MSYVVTLRDFTPPARFAPVVTPWTEARIAEAISSAGPWTTIDTVDLEPVDADPTQPSSRNFTSENATLTDGWYLITFIDEDGDEFAMEPVSTPTFAAFQPSVRDVGSLMRARTKDTNGDEKGTFDDRTRPKAEEVERIIVDALSDVTAQIGPVIPEGLNEKTKSAVKLRAAMLIELSYFPEQIRDDQSPYDRYKELYDDAMKNLVAAFEATEGTDVAGEAQAPNYAFPENVGGLVGWSTRM